MATRLSCKLDVTLMGYYRSSVMLEIDFQTITKKRDIPPFEGLMFRLHPIHKDFFMVKSIIVLPQLKTECCTTDSTFSDCK